MVLFPLPTKAAPTDEWASPTRIVKFSDGYEERAQDGLKRPRESWNVEVFYASDAAAQILKDFLREHGQHKPFQWKPPRDEATAQNYVITGAVSGATRRGGGSKPWFWTRSMRFDRWYGIVAAPVVLPPPTPTPSSFKLYLPFNGTNGSTTIVDSSSSPKTITANNVTLSTSFSKYGGSSAYFNGINSYLEIPNSQLSLANFDEFTVQFWVYMLAQQNTWLFGAHVGNQPSAIGSVQGGNLRIDNTLINNFSVPLPLDTWHHIAVTRNTASEGRVFVNGSLSTAVIDNFGKGATYVQDFRIGGSGTPFALFLNGYLDHFTISNTIDYTASFIPPIVPW